MRPCLLCDFCRLRDEHGRYSQECLSCERSRPHLPPFFDPPESVRTGTKSRAKIRRVNICYESVARPTPVRFLLTRARQEWERTCVPALECSWSTTIRSSASSSPRRSENTAIRLVARLTSARPCISLSVRLPTSWCSTSAC